ncbi:ATPase, F0 complex, subunit J [Epithele typhae]|uniref:ATPase, F0 complex, subunit J n=1 Tax=Epithele typhae TaxID=378194 RepID=UPI002008DA58|nr:ATPase, F0 complex, subunit J [Epithele typhae]KAH9910786.1 ATPase, F0 complex, subunit J [Epithele typhae]
MSFLGLRKWPTPARLLLHVLKPMWPFIAASVVTAFGVSTLQDMAVRAEPHRSDPRNPYASAIAKESHH